MANGTDGILNKPFGLNIYPERTIQQGKDTINSALNTLWQPLFNYLETNEKVFSGDISKEIDKYNRLTYNLGAQMRELKPQGSFDRKG